MSETSSAEPPLVEIGRYDKLADARERALVVAATELPHRIDREGDDWVLRVEAGVESLAARELASFEEEQRNRPVLPPEPASRPFETLSLYVVAWLLGGFFFTQNLLGSVWIERGDASSDALLRGEWWRAFTALTLHSDGSHLVANLATGLLFAGFLLPRIGTGCTWLAVVVTGALGNAINAWGYRGETHHSIGASTAVFGALGVLVALEVVERLSSAHTRNRWQLVLPLGAGLALLAFLGAGDEQRTIDHMAHCWGFVAGVMLGFAAGWLRLDKHVSTTGQRITASAALSLIALAWWRAWQ